MQSRGTASTARLVQRRDAWLAKLGQLGPMTRGSLVTARRGNHIAHQLTVSVEGKTHTVYVPPAMEKLLAGTAGALIRMRALDASRLYGYFTIAIDGTQMRTFDKQPWDGCPYRTLANGQKMKASMFLKTTATRWNTPTASIQKDSGSSTS
jgi:hypothetical protein